MDGNTLSTNIDNNANSGQAIPLLNAGDTTNLFKTNQEEGKVQKSDGNLEGKGISVEKVSVLMEFLRIFQEHVEKLRQLNLDQSEFSCLRALMLFSPGKNNLV